MKRLVIKGWEIAVCNTTISVLPNNMTVEGNLFLEGCKNLRSLPEGLIVEGSLYLDGCTSLELLPKDLVVNHSLWLHDSGIKEKFKLYRNIFSLEQLKEDYPEVFK